MATEGLGAGAIVGLGDTGGGGGAIRVATLAGADAAFGGADEAATGEGFAGSTMNRVLAQKGVQDAAAMGVGI